MLPALKQEFANKTRNLWTKNDEINETESMFHGYGGVLATEMVSLATD